MEQMGIQSTVALVGKVDPSKPEGQQVQFLPPSKVPIIGQIYVQVLMPQKVMQPLRLIEGPDNTITAMPISSRWFSDDCADCKAKLLSILDRAKNPPKEEQNDNSTDESGSGAADKPKLRLVHSNDVEAKAGEESGT